MSELKNVISKLESIALNPSRSIEQSCKEAVGCFPIYTPEEIIYAAGMLPIGMWGGRTELKESEAFLQGFCCSIMKMNMELGIKGKYNGLKAVIIPALCDTLKCVIENWKVAVPNIPMIAIVYPQNRWTTGAQEYLVTEYKRVRSELEKITKRIIPEQKIEEAYIMYEEYRTIMRKFATLSQDYPITLNSKTRHLIIKAGYFMDKAIYLEDIKKIINELLKNPKEKQNNINVITTGLICEPIELLDIFVENGITVVADDIAQESRQYRTIGKNNGSVWTKLADRIIDQRGCTFLAEQKKSRGEMLIEMAQKNNAKAIIVCMMKFCDPEEFDYPVYKAQLEKAKIPHLFLEVDQQMDSLEQIRTRVQSFVEMID